VPALAVAAAFFFLRDQVMPIPACVEPGVLDTVASLISGQLGTAAQVVGARETGMIEQGEARACDCQVLFNGRKRDASYTVRWKNRLTTEYWVEASVLELSVEQQVVEQAVEQYRIAKQRGTPTEICVQAMSVVAAQLQARDSVAYGRWQETKDRDCKAAGVPF
jgi:hypothetical protein